MIVWLYLLESDIEYRRIIDFFKKFDEVYGISYYVVESSLKLKNKESFGIDGRINIILRFSTHFLYFKKENEIIKESMISLVDLYHLSDRDNIDNRALCKLSDIDESEFDESNGYFKNGVLFILKEELMSHLKAINFKYKDGTSFNF